MLYLNVGKPPRKSASVENRSQRASVVRRCAVKGWRAINRARRSTEELWQMLHSDSGGRAKCCWEFRWGSGHQNEEHWRPIHAWPQSTGEDSIGMGWKIKRLTEAHERVLTSSVYLLIKERENRERNSQGRSLFERQRTPSYMGMEMRCSHRGKGQDNEKGQAWRCHGVMSHLYFVSWYTKRQSKTPTHEQTGALWSTETQPRGEAWMRSRDSKIRFTTENTTGVISAGEGCPLNHTRQCVPLALARGRWKTRSSRDIKN